MNPKPPDSPESDDRADPVWNLLGRSRKIPIDPHFARRVMAAVHNERESRRPHWEWLKSLLAPARHPAWAAAAILMGAALWWSHHGGDARITQPAIPLVAPAEPADQVDDSVDAELAMLDEVDELLAPQSPQELSDDDVGRTLF